MHGPVNVKQLVLKKKILDFIALFVFDLTFVLLRL